MECIFHTSILSQLDILLIQKSPKKGESFLMKSIIKDTFYKKVETSLKDKKNVDTFVKIVSSYLDRNTVNLSTIGPVKKTVFLDNTDRLPIYQLVNLEPNEMKPVIKTVHEFARSVNASDPFNVAMVLIIRYFHVVKDKERRKLSALYMMLSMYPSLFAKYFKFPPNENIMEYTISSMSNKYKIKQEASLLSALISMVTICDDHYDKDLIRGTDKDLSMYISAMKTRLNAFLKGICGEFMKQHKNKNYINYEEDNNDPDNFTVADNNSLLVQRVSQAVILNISVNGPDMQAVTYAAKMSSVSVNDLRSTVTNLCKEKKNNGEIAKMISAILYDYLFTGKNAQEEIYSTKFTVYALNTYKKSNTTNTNIVAIKKVLDKWLSEYSERYRKTNTASTINCFRKALYLFWVFTIQRTRV